jgi:hypothetical protein
MKALFAVTGRELAERRLLFLAALLLGLLALAAPWLPGSAGSDPAELRSAMATGLAMIVSFVLALVLGGVIVARDLGERRLGFYFARPLPGWAIWGGKMLAAALLSLGAGALVLLPALLAGGRIEFLDIGRGWGFDLLGALSPAFLVPLGLLLLLVTAHAVSIMIQARSPWLLLDGAALALIVATLWACREALLREWALDVLRWTGTGFMIASLVSGALAGLVQVTRGRTDLHRGHRLLSLTLWGLLGAATLGCAAYTRWVLTAEPEDLVSFTSVVPSPAGTWIGLEGKVAGRGQLTPMFLFDVASGRSVRLVGAFQDYTWEQPAFSANGRHAVWLEPFREGGYELLRLDLSRPGAKPVHPRISYPRMPQDLVLAPDGSRVAAVRGDRVTVENLDTGRLVASSIALPDGDAGRVRLRFLDPGRVRIFQSSPVEGPGQVWRLTIMDLEIASRRSVPVSSLDFPQAAGAPGLSRDGRYAVVRHHGGQSVSIADLVTERIVTLPLPQPLYMTFLDQSIVVAERERSTGKDLTTLRILRLDGTERRRIEIPGRSLRFGGRLGPSLFVAATKQVISPEVSGQWVSWTVDLESGRVRRIGPGVPAVWGPNEPGELAGRLLSRGGGELVLLEPATGELRTLLRGEPVQAAPR